MLTPKRSVSHFFIRPLAQKSIKLFYLLLLVDEVKMRVYLHRGLYVRMAGLLFELADQYGDVDIVVVSGPVTSQSKDRLLRTLEQVPEPRCIVTIGSCPQSGNVFKGSYSVEAPLEQYCHVDVAIAGCTPKPEAVIEGLYKAAQILKKKREAM